MSFTRFPPRFLAAMLIGWALVIAVACAVVPHVAIALAIAGFVFFQAPCLARLLEDGQNAAAARTAANTMLIVLGAAFAIGLGILDIFPNPLATALLAFTVAGALQFASLAVTRALFETRTGLHPACDWLAAQPVADIADREAEASSPLPARAEPR